MKIRYKNQDFQSEAVNAIIDVFKGQPTLNNKRSHHYLNW